MIRDKSRPSAPTFFVGLLAYAGITLISSVFSIAPVESLIDSRQLVLFLIVPAVYSLARGQRATTATDVIITVGGAAAVPASCRSACSTSTAWASGHAARSAAA